MKVEQHEATSADGTKIPYFIFTPKGFKANGKNPTLLYGYGGFEISQRAPLLGRHRRRLGRARRRLRAGQHPRRRRVRSRVAPGAPCRKSTGATSMTSSPWPRI